MDEDITRMNLRRRRTLVQEKGSNINGYEMRIDDLN